MCGIVQRGGASCFKKEQKEERDSRVQGHATQPTGLCKLASYCRTKGRGREKRREKSAAESRRGVRREIAGANANNFTLRAPRLPSTASNRLYRLIVPAYGTAAANYDARDLRDAGEGLAEKSLSRETERADGELRRRSSGTTRWIINEACRTNEISRATIRSRAFYEWPIELKGKRKHVAALLARHSLRCENRVTVAKIANDRACRGPRGSILNANCAIN